MYRNIINIKPKDAEVLIKKSLEGEVTKVAQSFGRKKKLISTPFQKYIEAFS